jgi:hypothetical protein
LSIAYGIRWVVSANTAAIAVDEKFRAREGAMNFYTLYRVHNYHFKIYGAMFLGQAQTALETADRLAAAIPEDLLRVEVPPMADWLEGFTAMKVHAAIRFGRWPDIIDAPLPADPGLYCVSTAMMRYAKGVACAASGRIGEAEEHRGQFAAAVERVPESRTIFNNTCRDILAVAGAMLDGEVEYRQGHHETAFAGLRRAVELDDGLPYDEPWAWMQPARHAYGALLLEQDRVAEAEAVYRADLGLDGTLARACQHPGNVSGACTAITNACGGWARTSRPASSGSNSRSRAHTRTCRSGRPVTAGSRPIFRNDKLAELPSPASADETASADQVQSGRFRATATAAGVRVNR